MSFASWTRARLVGDSGITSLVSTRVTPYVRNRDADFPCIVYSIPREELTTPATGEIMHRDVEVQISCMGRTHLDADTIAEAVIVALGPGTDGTTCVDAVRVQSLDREFADAYDGKPDLIYTTTVTAVLSGD